MGGGEYDDAARPHREGKTGKEDDARARSAPRRTLGEIGPAPPLWKNASPAPIGGRREVPYLIGRGGGVPGFRRKSGLRRREGGSAGAAGRQHETRERVDAEG
jgi:hypothetical protein